MKVRLTQIDGIIPNLALMKLSHYYKSKGDEVFFENSITPTIFEPIYDLVYASTIFTESKKKTALMKKHYTNAIIGGTGTDDNTTIEEHLGIVGDYPGVDYSIYPKFTNSLGFSQRGCRLSCGFCVVPIKEGKVKSLYGINAIYRGEQFPKNILLLDNDFFGQGDWKQKCIEIIEGDFRVSFFQGINIRLFTEAQAEYLKQIQCYDKEFKQRRIYTAWDNAEDESKFFRGIEILLKHFKPYQVSVYFLCNYWQSGLTEDIWLRYEKMVALGLRPYAMIFDKSILPPNHDLKVFQNWVNSQNHNANPTREGFETYKVWYVSKNKKPFLETMKLDLQ